MAVRVSCPHCNSVCQVDEQFLGAPVKCGKCSQPFTVRIAVPQTPTPSTTSTSPAPTDTSTPSRFGGLGAALRGVFRSFKAPARAEPVEEDLLELDGPGASALLDPGATASSAATACPGTVRLDIGSATSAGRVRSRNEDSFLVQQLSWSNRDRRRETALVVVADGMGGHEAGDQASNRVIHGVGGALTAFLSGQNQEVSPAQMADAVNQAVKEANRAVYEKAQSEAGCRGMGATAAVVLVCDGQAAVGHVGDCRVYHYHDGKLTQVTSDQTLVARMVELGQLTPAEALTHPSRHEVTQAVGRHADIAPATHHLPLAAGDWLITACDGLHAHVDDPLLEQAVREAPLSAAHLANQLIELANEGGGSDNCTVVVIRCY